MRLTKKNVLMMVLALALVNVKVIAEDNLTELNKALKKYEEKLNRQLNMNENVLKTAKFLGKVYKELDWGYNKYNCTEFLVQVMKSLSPEKCTSSFKNKINILSIKKSEVKKAVEAEQIEIKGIVRALVDAGIGEEITDMTKVKPGDFIQFWQKGKKIKKWSGHGAIVNNIVKPGVIKIYGSHASIGGFGIAKYEVWITDKKKKVYVVRLK